MTNKIKDILKTHKYLLLSFFLPVLLLEGIAIAEKIQPFGSESFLIVDALHQYLPFFADYQVKIKKAWIRCFILFMQVLDTISLDYGRIIWQVH